MATEIAKVGEIKAPKLDIRVLGVQIDTIFEMGGPHIKKTQQKMGYIDACARIDRMGSIFHAYKTNVLSSHTPVYGLTVWHALSEVKHSRKRHLKKVAVIKNEMFKG